MCITWVFHFSLYSFADSFPDRGRKRTREDREREVGWDLAPEQALWLHTNYTLEDHERLPPLQTRLTNDFGALERLEQYFSTTRFSPNYLFVDVRNFFPKPSFRPFHLVSRSSSLLSLNLPNLLVYIRPLLGTQLAQFPWQTTSSSFATWLMTIFSWMMYCLLIPHFEF